MAYGVLTWKDNDDPGGAGVGNNCGVDASRKIMFLCHEAGGLNSYQYTADGILTHVDTEHRSGLSLGCAVDTDRMLVFEAANIKVGLQPEGTTQSYLYDTNGNLTFVDNVSMAWMVNDQAKGIDIDTDYQIILVAMGNNWGIVSYNYDNAGNITYRHWNNPGGAAYGVCIDQTNKLAFLFTKGDGVHSYTYDAVGNLTHKDHDDQGGDANGGVCDIDRKLLFVSNGSRELDVYSYNVNGTLTHIANYDTGLGSGMYGIDIDTYSQVVFLANHIAGIYTYNYTDAGICTLNDTDDQGGLAYGAKADTINHLVFLANWDRGVESYAYTYRPVTPPPDPIITPINSWLNLSRTRDRFLMRPNWIRSPEKNFDFYRELYEFAGTVLDIYGLGDNYSVQISYGFDWLNKEDENKIIEFFCNHRGKHHRFWLPVWENPFTLQSNINENDTVISIRNVGFNLVDRGYEHIFFWMKDGAWLSRSCIAIVGNGNTEDILLHDAIDRDISSDDYWFFGKLKLVRFNDDSLKLKHKNDSVSSCQLDFIELPFEYGLEVES